MPVDKRKYPDNWKEISLGVRNAVNAKATRARKKREQASENGQRSLFDE